MREYKSNKAKAMCGAGLLPFHVWELVFMKGGNLHFVCDKCGARKIKQRARNIRKPIDREWVEDDVF